MTQKKKASQGKGSGKKPYGRPHLVVHGDLRAITKAKQGGASDGSGKPHTKSPTGAGA